MQERLLLAPVIFLIAAGLILGDFGQPVQARTTSGRDTSILSVQRDTAQGQSVQKKQDRHSIKKTKSTKKTHIAEKTTKKKHSANTSVASKKHPKKARYAKHTGKVFRHQHSRISDADNNFETVSSIELTPNEPIDLWLAKDALDKIRKGAPESELDELTLKILESAYSYLGTPYRYGGTTPDGFDCSGFVRYIFSENGISLGRSSREQALEGKSIPLSDLKPGDLLFFNMHRRKHSWIDHVGLYVGKGQFIHAASRRSHEIKIEDLETDRYLPKIVEARRVLDYTR
jgi:murein DD-endopeptidase